MARPSTCRPASVIRTRATMIGRAPAITRPVVAVASPVRISSTICSTVKPCESMIASVQPSGHSASSSSARRRVAGALRLRLCVGIGRKHRPKLCRRTKKRVVRVGNHCRRVVAVHRLSPLRGVEPPMGASGFRGQDLNLRPSGYEPDELNPGCSTPLRTKTKSKNFS